VARHTDHDGGLSERDRQREVRREKSTKERRAEGEVERQKCRQEQERKKYVGVVLDVQMRCEF
jgi:hypothetical protein